MIHLMSVQGQVWINPDHIISMSVKGENKPITELRVSDGSLIKVVERPDDILWQIDEKKRVENQPN